MVSGGGLFGLTLVHRKDHQTKSILDPHPASAHPDPSQINIPENIAFSAIGSAKCRHEHQNMTKMGESFSNWRDHMTIPAEYETCVALVRPGEKKKRKEIVHFQTKSLIWD